MADTKISALPAATAAALTNEFAINEAGTSKKLTASQLMVLTQPGNYSVAAQTFATAARTYIIGSAIQVPAAALKIGTRFRWTFVITKTAAGTALSTYDIAFGTTGTTTDTARVAFVKIAGTGVIDVGKIVIEAVVRGPIEASGIVAGSFNLTHNLSATGHSTLPCGNVVTISAAFDVTTPTYIGLCVTTGALDVITTQYVRAEVCGL